MKKEMTNIQRLKKLFYGKLPRGYHLHFKYGQYEKSQTELAARKYFELMIEFSDYKKRAKKMGLI